MSQEETHNSDVPRTASEWIRLAQELNNQPQNSSKQSWCYENVLRLDPDNLTALCWLGRHFNSMVDESGKPVEASVRYLTRASELAPENADIWVWLSQSLFNRHRIEEGERAVQRALSINPENAEAHFSHWTFLAKRNAPNSEKVAALSACLRRDPNHFLAKMMYRSATGTDYGPA